MLEVCNELKLAFSKLSCNADLGDLWSLFGLAVATQRWGAAMALLQAGASPILFKRTIVQWNVEGEEDLKCKGKEDLSKRLSDELNILAPSYASWILQQVFSCVLRAKDELRCRTCNMRPVRATKENRVLHASEPEACPSHICAHAFCETCMWRCFCEVQENYILEPLLRCPYCRVLLFPELDSCILNDCAQKHSLNEEGDELECRSCGTETLSRTQRLLDFANVRKDISMAKFCALPKFVSDLKEGKKRKKEKLSPLPLKVISI